jgi:hypothetical protein
MRQALDQMDSNIFTLKKYRAYFDLSTDRKIFDSSTRATALQKFDICRSERRSSNFIADLCSCFH